MPVERDGKQGRQGLLLVRAVTAAGTAAPGPVEGDEEEREEEEGEREEEEHQPPLGVPAFGPGLLQLPGQHRVTQRLPAQADQPPNLAPTLRLAQPATE